MLTGEAGVGKTRRRSNWPRSPRRTGRGSRGLDRTRTGTPPCWLGRQVFGPDAPVAAGDDRGPHNRDALFDAVSSSIAARAGDRGALIVLDDVQWADTPSVVRLRHAPDTEHLEVGSYAQPMAEPASGATPIVPELDVEDLAASLRFYVGVIGFTLIFERPSERFVYLALSGAEIMLQDGAGPGRRFRTAPLEHPFGRGINLQIAVPSVDEVFDAVLAAGIEPILGIEERWYDVDVVTPSGRWTKRGRVQAGNRQFVVADPDGYLLRLYTDLGTRPL